MMINEVTQRAGRHERRKRVGRGESSGMGRTSGRGNKGAQSRAGYGGRILYEGGQMPIFRRLPKRGFSNVNFRTEYSPVNLDVLAKFFPAGANVTVDELRAHSLIRGKHRPVKILGRGELPHKLTVEAHAFSDAAKAAIEKAGGTVKLIEQRDAAANWQAKRNTQKKVRAARAEKGEKAGK